ncbi:MAG: TlpA family protein disulfide reductase [Saprospiraceae bacterium]|nr:TlpA family protein disulfide reductase [Saprospiraceae bacterium]
MLVLQTYFFILTNTFLLKLKISMRLIFIFILLLRFNLLLAQTSYAVRVMETVNEKLANIKQGYFDCGYHWKSATDNDTSSNYARIYFFKSESWEDSICRFVMMRDGKLSEAYDGTYFYYINNNARTISASLVSEKGGVVKILRKSSRDFLIFRPYILQKPAFALSKFNNAIVDTFEMQTKKAVRITVFDSFKNELKLQPSDPDMAQVKEVFEITLPDATLFRKQEIIKLLAWPQYLENNLSPITVLSDSITFEHIFNIALLQSNGYELKLLSKKTSTQSPQFSIKAGDTLPSFKLFNLEGEEFSSKNLTEGYILVDFWYKGCAPCLMAMPMLERLHKKYKNLGLNVLGINGHDKNQAGIKSFIQERSVSYNILLDTDNWMTKKLRILTYPTMILVEAKSHEVIMVHSGFSEEIEAKIESFMEKK